MNYFATRLIVSFLAATASTILPSVTLAQGPNRIRIDELHDFRDIDAENAGVDLVRVNVLWLLFAVPLDLTDQQRNQIQSLVDLQMEMENAASRELSAFYRRIPVPFDEEAKTQMLAKSRQVNNDRLQSRLDLERRIAELLTDEQLGRLRTAAKAAALTRFNNFNELVAAAMKQNDVKFEFEAGTFERQQEILARYRERLRRLQAETVDELLKTLPPEARKATEELMALDVLQRKD